MSLTNDPQAGYEPAEEGRVTHEYELTMKVIDLGVEQREPMLSDGDKMRCETEWANSHKPETINEAFCDGFDAARILISAKITNGELMASNTVKNESPTKPNGFFCSGCNAHSPNGRNGRMAGYEFWKFCPGCGARIIE